MRKVRGNPEESGSRGRWALRSRAAEKLRKKRMERGPLDLAMWGSPLTLTGVLSGWKSAWDELGRAHAQYRFYYYPVNHER